MYLARKSPGLFHPSVLDALTALYPGTFLWVRTTSSPDSISCRHEGHASPGSRSVGGFLWFLKSLCPDPALFTSPHLLELASLILPATIELTSPMCASILPVPPPTSAIDPWHLKSLWIILVRRLTFRGTSPMKYAKNKERDRKKCYLKPRLNSISRGFPIKKNWNMFIGSKICSLLLYIAEDLKRMHSFLCFAFHFLGVFLFFPAVLSSTSFPIWALHFTLALFKHFRVNRVSLVLNNPSDFPCW